MSLSFRNRPLTRTAVAGAVVVSALGLAGCSDDDQATEETQAPAADTTDTATEEPARPFTGPYGSDFYGDLESFEGEEVTVSATVQQVIAPNSFLIESAEDANTEALLVVGANEVRDLEVGDMVSVTGTVETAFDLESVEEQLEVDLDPESYAQQDSEPYIEATEVEEPSA